MTWTYNVFYTLYIHQNRWNYMARANIPPNTHFVAWTTLNWIDPTTDFDRDNSVQIDIPWKQRLIGDPNWDDDPEVLLAGDSLYYRQPRVFWGENMGGQNHIDNMHRAYAVGDSGDYGTRLWFRMRRPVDPGRDVRALGTGIVLGFPT